MLTQLFILNRHSNPSHFWLNEGWTTYFERLLKEKLDSPAARGFAYIVGAKSLQIALAQYEATPKYRRLVIDFEENEDPDVAYSRVPYEKGANFILHLGTHSEVGPSQQVFISYHVVQSELLEALIVSCRTQETTFRPSLERASPHNSGKTIFINTGRPMVGQKWFEFLTAWTGVPGFTARVPCCP